MLCYMCYILLHTKYFSLSLSLYFFILVLDCISSSMGFSLYFLTVKCIKKNFHLFSCSKYVYHFLKTWFTCLHFTVFMWRVHSCKRCEWRKRIYEIYSIFLSVSNSKCYKFFRSFCKMFTLWKFLVLCILLLLLRLTVLCTHNPN